MMKATLRCKRLLQVILSKEETLSIKRMQALPDDEQTAVKEELALYEQL